MSFAVYQFDTLVWRYSLANWRNSYLGRIALLPHLFSCTGDAAGWAGDKLSQVFPREHLDDKWQCKCVSLQFYNGISFH